MKTLLPIAAAAQLSRGTRRALLALLICAVAAALTAIAGAAIAPGSTPVRSDPSTPDGKQGLKAYGKLPLSFVPNAGQLDRRVRYSAQAGGAGFYFTKREAVFSFAKGKKGLALRLRFPGADPDVRISASRRASGKVNYLIGYDPADWRTNLPTYGELVYHDLWPGIDLRFRGEHGQLKYEFLVKPGADAGAIRLAYRGVERLSLDKRGNLQLGTALGRLTDSRPVSYQELAARRMPVASRFVVARDRNAYRFAVGAYDRSRPLVVDPGLVYSTYLGGSDGIAVDGAGFAYVTGSADAGFPTTAGAFDRDFNGGSSDAFVAKLNAAGSELLYSTFLGGTDYDASSGIAVDGAGDAYITGTTDSADFPVTLGAFDTSYNRYDAFVSKLNADGSNLLYSTFLGGGSPEGRGSRIAIDGAGNAYVTGTTTSPDFPTTPGAFDTSLNGSPLWYCVVDAFVSKLNATGSELLYSTYLGGSCSEPHADIAVDGAGDAYVTGSTESDDFPITAGAFDTSPDVGTDAFVTKLNAAGSDLLYSTFLAGSGSDSGDGIAVDGAGSAYVTGSTASSDFPTTPGVIDTENNGLDAFVTKLNVAGSGLLYSTYLGGSGFLSASGSDAGFGIAVDGAGAAYVTGRTGSADFPTTPGAFDSSLNGGGSGYLNNGDDDAFVTKLNAAASKTLYSTYLGGTASDGGIGLAVDSSGDAYITGVTLSADFPTTAGAFDLSYNGGPDGDRFAAKLDPRAPPPPPVRRCVVPRVIGMRLAKARTRVGLANCRVGRVRRAHTRPLRVGKVVSQSPRAGSRRTRGARVNLVVGRR
ncbi:MAG: SBBP repeat-containing protein [Actinomycetota bacterium]